MTTKRKRFNSERSATSFAKKVNGTVNDLREIKEAKSKFTVTYQSIKERQLINNTQFSPEDDKDFGYSNEFWK